MDAAGQHDPRHSCRAGSGDAARASKDSFWLPTHVSQFAALGGKAAHGPRLAGQWLATAGEGLAARLLI